MNAPTTPSLPPSDLHELVARYREIKHGINNTLGVIMALSELTERNAETFTKLNEVIMERSPKVVAELQEFGTWLQQLEAESK